MIRKIITIVIAVWVIISITRVFINFTRFLMFDLNFVFLQEQTKREKLLPCYKVALYLNEFISNEETLYIDYPNNGLCFFTLRYYLYPVRVYTSADKKLNPENYTYILTTENNKNYGKRLLKNMTIESSSVYIYK